MSDNPKEYLKNIKKLYFQIEDELNSSVFIVSELKTYVQEKKLSPYIFIALERAALFHVDAVYFRFFDDERPPLPQLYIYDNISNPRSDEYYADRHREIWSSCEVVSFLIIDKTQIKVFDTRTPVKYDDVSLLGSDPMKMIDLSDLNNAIKDYHAQFFDNGSFWDMEENKNNFLFNRAASKRLIGGLIEIRRLIRECKMISEKLSDQLLIICILIKYLEENGIDANTQENLAKKFFYEKTGCKDLEDIISCNKMNLLLDALAEHFQGGIFALDPDLKAELNEKDISFLARFFEAGYKNDLFEWREYSFEHIPVELISNFYEEFVPKEKNNPENNSKNDTGAVYTPSFLVNLLVDECLPLSYNTLNENVELIDPACGSGIFLVTAYKRLVQRWRLKNKESNKLANTNPEKLKEILSKNIYGVDTHQNSVNLSIFSLQLALCSMLTPKQIWTELKELSNLRADGNITQNDFFEYLSDDKHHSDFDLVIGNPPFRQNFLGNRKFDDYKELLSKKHPVEFKNPRKEFAFLFLEMSMHLLKKETGKLCLILPSGPILYTEQSRMLRQSLFSKYDVSQIIDFIFLRRVLFQATISTLAIFVSNRSPTEEDVLHIIARRTKSSKEKHYFEFDHYDYLPIPKDLAKSEFPIWKLNLIGGYRVFELVDKINKIKPDLNKFCLENNISVKSRVYKHDIKSNKNANELPLFEDNSIIKGKYENICWAIKKSIKGGSIGKNINLSDFKKEIEAIDAISFKGSKRSIKLLQNYFRNHSDLICFYIIAVSGRQGIRSPYVFSLPELKKFPYSKNISERIGDNENIIINDVIHFKLEEFGKGEDAKNNISLANNENIETFCYTYCNTLNSLFGFENKKYKPKIIIMGNAYSICDFNFTNEQIEIEVNNTDKSLSVLLFGQNPSQSGRINKVLRIYGNETIRIVKPRQLRFWLKSIALWDADETYNEMVNY